jgi:uncharacterized protein YdhG (YjbR/CyaY superfamily)
MAAKDFKSVDEYISSQPEPVRGTLELVRSAIRKALPGAEETISYKMPTYKLHGGTVLHFAGWKQFYSLYPAGERLVAAFKDELQPYKINKATIRFPFTGPVPLKLIERIAKFRAQEAAEHDKAMAAAKK